MFVYALAVAWFSWNYYPIGQTRSVENDFFAWYVTSAKKMLAGNFSDLKGGYRFNPLGYSCLLAFVKWIVGDFFVAGKIISIVSSALALLCIYFLIKRIFDPLLAILVLPATAANKHFILSSYYVGTDMLFMALACLTLLVLVSGDGGYKKALAAGGLTGLAYLTRYNGIFLIPVAAWYLFFQPPEKNFWQRLRPCAVYLFAFAAAILPWHLFLLARKGTFFFNENYLNLAFDFLSTGINKDHWSLLYKQKYQSFGDVLFSDPGMFLWNVFLNIGNNAKNIFNQLIPDYLGLFVIIGIPLLLTRSAKSANDGGKCDCLFLSYLVYFLLMGLIHFEARYFLYLAPLISLAYIYSFCQIFKKVPHKYLAEPLRGGILVGIILYAGWGAVSFHFKYSKTFNTEILTISNFMRFVAGPSQTLMARSANIGYFSHLRWKHLSAFKNPSALAKAARADNADFIFYSVVESVMQPELGHLVLYETVPGLQKIAEWRPSRRKAAVYRVLPDETTTGIFAANRANFKTDDLWREFLRKTASPAGRVSLEGVLIIHTPGQYTLAFSASKFSLAIDGKTVMDDRRSNSSFVSKTLTLEKGFHVIRITFSANPRHIVPLGLFWETPNKSRQAVPRSAFVVNRVLAPPEGGT